jgi:hypothetical protein
MAMFRKRQLASFMMAQEAGTRPADTPPGMRLAKHSLDQAQA